MHGLAINVRAGVQQHESIVRRRNDRGNARALHAGKLSQPQGGQRQNAAGVAQGNRRVRTAIADHFNRAGHGGILFLAERGGGLVVHRHHFAGVNDLDAVVAQVAGSQSGLDILLLADQKYGANFRVGGERTFDAFDDNPATVVATHDIHCNSHKGIRADKMPPTPRP